VRLVKLNIDVSIATPARYGVLALPTVMLFTDGEPRATVHGAQPRARYERDFAPFLG
jgi:thioredoxin 1